MAKTECVYCAGCVVDLAFGDDEQSVILVFLWYWLSAGLFVVFTVGNCVCECASLFAFNIESTGGMELSA